MATKTSGIRFKVEDMAFVQKRENLDTVQKVFSFLMNEYLKLYRVEKKSVFDFQLPKDYVNVQNVKTIPPQVDKATYYQTEIDNFRGGIEEGEILMGKILADTDLTKWQQNSFKTQLNSKA